MQIGWYGWDDPLSGIAEYHIEVYKLSPLGDAIGYGASPHLLLETYEALPGELTEFIFPETGTGVRKTIV